MSTATETQVVISISGTVAWRDWLNGLARHVRTDKSKLIDQLATEFAEHRGYPAPPPRWPDRGQA